jgi:hypothetical protein
MRGGAPLGRSLTGQVTVGSPRSDGGDQAVSDELLRKEPYRDERPLTMVSPLPSLDTKLTNRLTSQSHAPQPSVLPYSVSHPLQTRSHTLNRGDGSLVP